MNVAVPPPTWTTAPSGVAAGIVSSRRRCTSSVVAWSCGDVVGITWMIAASPASFGCGGVTAATPGVASIAVVS